MRHARWTVWGLAAVVLLSTPFAAACSTSEPAQEPPPASEAPPASRPGTEAGDTESDAAHKTLTVTLYWVSAGQNALGVKRAVPLAEDTAAAALHALLQGPTEAEKATWPQISTAIPQGTKLLGLTVSDGIAKVDLSSEFESGGGSFSMTARLAQVVYTLDELPAIDAVELYIEGKRVTVFSDEGIVIDGPMKAQDFSDLLPIDA